VNQNLPHLKWELHDSLVLLQLDRASKRNAISDELIQSLTSFFEAPPPQAKVVVLHGAGDNFCAGLDLLEYKEKSPFEAMKHSQSWHRCFERIQFGGLPVVAALKGAVIGGGLEIAMATHVRVSEPSTFYELPEGMRGIFVGGGASVRVARAIGSGRMTEMMLTGRRYNAEDGVRLGLAHHLVGAGEALAKAIELATTIAGNAPISNYAMLTAIARIEDMSMSEGLYTESVMAALAQTSEEAKARITAFFEGRQRAQKAAGGE
jgi:enoyl-CoA hydratase/carnithine racemase